MPKNIIPNKEITSSFLTIIIIIMKFKIFLESTDGDPVELKANIPLPEEVFMLSRAFKKHGYLLYVVGGAVRDFLMGQTPKDVDVATNATPNQVGEILTKEGIRNFPKGEAFGVWVAHINGEDYEIATFRKEEGTSNGRRPDQVTWTTPSADAKRRDLTINALFYQIPTNQEENGKILDYFGGQAIEDVKNKTIRVVGDPFDRFGEDRLRILRIPRFHNRFSDKELELDDKTASAIDYYKNLRGQASKYHPERGLEKKPDGSLVNLDPISGERIQKEFESGLLKSKNIANYLKTYEKFGLLDSVFPGLHVDTQSLERLLDTSAGKNINVVLAFLLRKNDPDKVRHVLNKLNWINSITNEVHFLLKLLNYTKNNESIVPVIKEMVKKPSRRKDIKDFQKVLGNDVNQIIWSHLSDYKPELYSGEEIMKRFNISNPGPKIGDKQKELTNQHYQKSLEDYLKKNR